MWLHIFDNSFDSWFRYDGWRWTEVSGPGSVGAGFSAIGIVLGIVLPIACVIGCGKALLHALGTPFLEIDGQQVLNESFVEAMLVLLLAGIIPFLANLVLAGKRSEPRTDSNLSFKEGFKASWSASIRAYDIGIVVLVVSFFLYCALRGEWLSAVLAIIFCPIMGGFVSLPCLMLQTFFGALNRND